MKIYNQITFDIDTWKVLDEDFFEYEGELAYCEPASIIYWIVYIVITLITAYMSYKMATDAMDLDSESAGIKANTKTTREPLRIIYGTNRVGGNDVWGHTGSKHNKRLFLSMTVGEGQVQGLQQVDGVDQIFIDDKLWTKVGTQKDKFTNDLGFREEQRLPVVKWTFFDGSPDQAVHSRFTSAAGANFTDTMENTSWMAYEFLWDEDKFRGIPKRETVIEGLLVHDMRVPSAANAFSDNPSLVLWDFLTNKRYGIGLDSSALDPTTFSTAANYCDSKGWGCNLVVTRSDRTSWSIVEEIKSTFRGTLTYFNGMYFLLISDLNEESSVMDLTDEHIFQDTSGKASITISQPSRFASPTGMRVAFIDKEKLYAEDYIMIGEQDETIEDLQLFGVNDREQASNLGFYYLERGKLNRTITGTFRDDALLLEPMDLVTLTTTALGITDQLMRVEETTLTQTGLVNLTLKYESIELYDDDFDIDIESVYDVDLPDPTLPSVILNASLSEETVNYRLRTFTRLNINFDLDPDDPWYQHCEVWVATVSAGEPAPDIDDFKMQFTTQDLTYIDQVTEGYTYHIRLRTVNTFGTKQDLEDEATYLFKTITGILPVAPPSLEFLNAIPGDHTLVLTSDKLNSPDIELYEFRLGSTWNGAIFFSAKRAPTEHLTNIKTGTFTFWCNTKGYNGLYGENPQSATVTIREPAGWTLLEEFSDNYTGGPAEVLSIVSGGISSDDFTLSDRLECGINNGVAVAVILDTPAGAKNVTDVTWDYNGTNIPLTKLTDFDPSHNDMRLELWYHNNPTSIIRSGEVRVQLQSPGQLFTAYAFSYHGSIGDESQPYNYVTDERSAHPGGRVVFQDMPIHIHEDIGLTFVGWDDTGEILTVSAGTTSEKIGELQTDGAPNDFQSAVWKEAIPQNENLTVAWESSGGTLADTSTMGVQIHGDDNEFHNTEHLDYVGADWLKSSHNITYDPTTSGSYLTNEFEVDTARDYLVYTEEDIVVIGAGTTWNDLLDPSGANRTWDDVNAPTRTWADMFTVEEAPKVFIEVWYKENEGDPWIEITGMQIAEAVVFGKFFRVRIAIEDPATNINALVSEIKLELYYQA